MKHPQRLIVFTRYPEPGVTKTRLIPLLGPEGAGRLQRRMTEHTLSQVKGVCHRDGIQLEVRYAGGKRALMETWLGPDFLYQTQSGKDLGLRMAQSFEAAFADGAETVVLIGTDIPRITGDIIRKAFDRLRQDDFVCGPTKDGGYYLIGMRPSGFQKARKTLFADISWGSATVLDQTLRRAKRTGLRFSLLERLADVDRPEDLHRCAWLGKLNPVGRETGDISIIIPTLNEADHIGRTLSRIEAEHVREIIVVDGGSEDQTKIIAESMGGRLIESRPPKARQMNMGADGARGRILLFLHADTCLPKRFATPLLKAVERPGFSGGAFSLRIDSDRRALRVIEMFAYWRSRYFQFPYGDQAIFMSRDTFRSLGGFPNFPIMEDFELVRRLKKRGTIVTLDAAVRTASRRWDNFGILKTFLVNQVVVLAYYAGVSPRRIARFYRREGGLRNK